MVIVMAVIMIIVAVYLLSTLLHLEELQLHMLALVGWTKAGNFPFVWLFQPACLFSLIRVHLQNAPPLLNPLLISVLHMACGAWYLRILRLCFDQGFSMGK